MYNREYTPEWIVDLKDNEIFVFGSNLAGSHGGGAAWLAYERFGAVWGQGVSLQGKSYGIPTMQGGVETAAVSQASPHMRWLRCLPKPSTWGMSSCPRTSWK